MDTAPDCRDGLLAHVVLTRFAVRLTEDAAAPSDEWIARRRRLFEAYCLPSMQAQTRQDFRWVLFVDPGISETSRAELASYRSVLPGIVVADLSPDDPLGYERAVRALLPDEATAVVTTRIDNDDAVSVDHIARIREAVAGVAADERRAFVFTSGYELSAGRLYWRPFPRSPFASLVEPTLGTLSTVMGAGHEALDAVAPVTELAGDAAWLQVVHGDNILNRVRGVRVPRSRLHGAFVVADEALYRPESRLGLLAGVPASYARLGWDVATNPRYLKKVVALLTGQRG